MHQAVRIIAASVVYLGFSLGQPVFAQIDEDLPSQSEPVEVEPSVAPVAAPTAAPKVVLLPEDELILPPLLKRFEGGSILNVTSLNNKKRSAKAGEWLEYGDFFSLPQRLSFQVIMRETIQWIGGGVFQGRIGQRTWKEDHTPYELFLERGWMKVWVKPDVDQHSVKIYTKNAYLKASKAEFWLTTRPGRTEIYLVDGEITDSKGNTYTGPKFYLWEGESQNLKYSSKGWNEAAIQVQLSALFPSLVQLAGKAQADWKSGATEDTYADLRRKGWRKVDRLEPDPAVYPKQKKK